MARRRPSPRFFEDSRARIRTRIVPTTNILVILLFYYLLPNIIRWLPKSVLGVIIIIHELRALKNFKIFLESWNFRKIDGAVWFLSFLLTGNDFLSKQFKNDLVKIIVKVLFGPKWGLLSSVILQLANYLLTFYGNKIEILGLLDDGSFRDKKFFPEAKSFQEDGIFLLRFPSALK